MEVPEETAIAYLVIQSGKRKVFEDKGTHAILAGLVSIAKTLLQPKCGRTRKLTKKMGYTHNAIVLSRKKQ